MNTTPQHMDEIADEDTALVGIVDLRGTVITQLKARLTGLRADSHAGYESVKVGIAEVTKWRTGVEASRKKLVAPHIAAQKHINLTAYRTRDYLLEAESALSYYRGGLQLTDDRAHVSSDLPEYEKILALHQNPSGNSTINLDQAIELLLEEVDQGVERAWHLENQGRWQEAINEYREISELVPDVNAPITHLIVRRIRWAESKQ